MNDGVPKLRKLGNELQPYNTPVCRFSPHQEEVCEENYKKKCTIVFVTQSQTETVGIQTWTQLQYNPEYKEKRKI